MKDLQEILKTVETLFDGERFQYEPKGLYEPIDYTLRLGGKRLRPALLLASCQMMGGDTGLASSAAVGIETFHNFTLLHDDLMDRSPLRRGKPTVWSRWNANTAILSGDTMYALAWRMFLRQPHTHLREILNCFNETAIEVCEGQQYDMDFESRDNVSLDEYMMMIRKKTAVLLAGAMKIGAMYAGAQAGDLCHIYDCGINMGLAFQIQDDLLDAYGNQQSFGKPIGQDIRDHKKTYMILRALELSDDTAALKTLYNRGQHNEETVSQILHLYETLGIRQQAEQVIDRLMQAAVNDLQQVSAATEAKKPIFDLFATLASRKK
mgnify:FL=1